MSVKGSFKVTVTFKDANGAEMVIRADMITATPDGQLYVLGDGQKRRFVPSLWKNITIENDSPQATQDA